MPRHENERDQLVSVICDSMRMLHPELRPDDYFVMRQRLRASRVEVLREILESDFVSPAAAGLLPTGMIGVRA